MCDEIQKKDVEGLHVKTDSKGIAKVEDIEQGLYFIDPVDMRPMLVSVPQWQEDELVYSVVVYPKHSPFEKLILKKVDQETIPL